jgi:hypothetical protein
MDPDGNGRDFPCPNQVNNANTANTALSHVDRSSNSPGGSSYGHNLPWDIFIMLCVPPETARSSFGYIYLVIDERIHQKPLLAFSNNAGWAIHVLPCPDFDVFLRSKFIGTRDTLFTTNLPPHIIPAGHHLLENNKSSWRTQRPTSPGSQTFL